MTANAFPTTVDGQRVRRAVRVPRHPHDDARAFQCRYLGRALVELANGQRIDAMLLASTEARTLGDQYAAFYTWDETSTGRVSRLVLVEIVREP